MKQVMVNGFPMAYRDEGSGKPLVLVHAFPLTSLMWNPQVEELKRDYRVIAPDVRGFGESAAGAPRDRFSSVEEYAADLAAFLEQIGLGQEKVVLVGLSMGGYIAFDFYRRYAHMLRGLVLCDTRSEADSDEARQNRFKLIESVRQGGMDAVADASLPKLLSPENYGTRPDLVAELSRLIRYNDPYGTIAAAGALANRPDSTGLLGTIKVKTLVMCGKDDQITPADGARKMAQAIPDWQLSIIPHAGHLSNLENPEFFNQALHTFLKDLK
jgi:pimeloyl-ACP methyl ester carboxylesterase